MTSIEAGISMNQSGFDLNGHSGQYAVIMPHFQYVYLGKWILAGTFPAVGLVVEGKTNWGFRNPLLLGERRFFPGTGNRISVGTQVEFPFGDHENGLAAEHTMLLPYLGFQKRIETYFISATLGFSTTVGEEHEEESAAAKQFLYVAPHEDREFLYQISSGISIWSDKAVMEVFLTGQHVMVGEREAVANDDDLSAGMLFPFRFTRAFTVEPHIEVPLLTPGRFDWTIGADFRVNY